MKTYNGFSSQTSQNLLLDSGAFFVNFDVHNDTYETAQSKLIGATCGGGAFEAKPTIRDVKVDGVKGKAKGLQILNNWTVTMSAKLLEFKKETFQRALTASQVTDDTINGKSYNKIQAKNQIELNDYIDNITWLGTISGSNEPVIIQIFNVLDLDGLKIDAKDNSDIVAELKFTGTYDTDELDVPPFIIYYPVRIEDSTSPTVSITPADAATAVAVDSNVLFTFSEAIAPLTVNSANFVVLKVSDGMIVPGNLSLSADKTIVTFNPTDDLSAATAYIAMVSSNVEDLAGNKLENNIVSNFATV